MTKMITYTKENINELKFLAKYSTLYVFQPEARMWFETTYQSVFAILSRNVKSFDVRLLGGGLFVQNFKF